MISKKIFFIPVLTAVLMLFSTVYSHAEESDGINSSNHGLHLRGALGGGQILWGYISHSSGSGDLGTGPGATINLAAMYNYWIFGVEGNLLSGNISSLEWEDDGDTYKSTGTGNYTVLDIKLGLKLFSEPGDMGYTYFYGGKRFWSSERTEETREFNGVSVPAAQEEKREAKGDGWIIGFRDFSTFGWDEGLAIVVQTGLFLGKAPVSEMKTNGVDQSFPVKKSYTAGGEIAGGIALQNLGLTIVGGLRAEATLSTLKDPAAPAGEESGFGFGNRTFFVEASLMF